jgi:hypothetical protein
MIVTRRSGATPKYLKDSKGKLMRSTKPILLLGIISLIVVGSALPAAAEDTPSVATEEAPLPGRTSTETIQPVNAGDDARSGIVIAPAPDPDPETPVGPEEPMVIAPAGENAETVIVPNPDATIGIATAGQSENDPFPVVAVSLGALAALILLGGGAWIIVRNR